MEPNITGAGFVFILITTLSTSSLNNSSNSVSCVHLKPCLQYMAEPPPRDLLFTCLSCLNGSSINVNSTERFECFVFSHVSLKQVTSNCCSGKRQSWS